jgi:Protein of unknown function (DUF2971)
MAMQPITFAPKYLYRYRSLPDYAIRDRDKQRIRALELDALTAPYLWCSAFHSMNDPMEGSYALNREKGKGDAYENARQFIYHRKISLGICSFSETNNNSPMWAYYADQFRGICIEYDLQALLNSLGDCCDEGLALVRMTYSEDLYQLSVNADSHETAAQQILSFKSHRWLHEREWRLFKDGPGKLEIEPRCISHVYVGDRMEQKEIQRLTRSLRRSGIAVSRMELDGYSMAFEPI